MRADPTPQAGRDRAWLAIAMLALWLTCGAASLIGAAELIRRSLKLWWPTWS